MSNNESSLQDIITQLVSLNLYLLKIMGEENPAKAQSIAGYAIEHCRRNEKIEPRLLIELYEMAFPGKALPQVLSETEFAEAIKRQQSESS